jgi:hypothetical protein
MIDVQITPPPNTVNAVLAGLRNPLPVLKVAANAVRRQLQDHFRARPPNRLGWPSHGLWRSISAATAVADVTPAEAVISVTHPAILAKVNPQTTITPKRGRFLAIPAISAAYAAGSPREGGAPANLTFVYSRHPQGGWRPSLAVQTTVTKEVGKPRRDGTRRVKTVNRAGEIWYWLVRRAVVHGDPNALPSDDLVADVAISAALTFLNSPYGARSQVSP